MSTLNLFDKEELLHLMCAETTNDTITPTDIYKYGSNTVVSKEEIELFIPKPEDL